MKAKYMAMQDQAPMNEKMSEDQMKAKYMAMQDQAPMNEKMVEEEKRRKDGLIAMRKEGYRQEPNAPAPYSRGD